MAFWNVDLETRMGAESAANQGSLACFIFAGFSVLAAVFAGAVLPSGLADNNAALLFYLTVVGVQLAVVLVAGFRLRAGKGAFWGLAATALMALNTLSQLISFALIALVISAILLVFMVQGVRGAFALRNAHFSEDEIEAFE